MDKIIKAHEIFYLETGIEISPDIDRALKKILPMFESKLCSDCLKIRKQTAKIVMDIQTLNSIIVNKK